MSDTNAGVKKKTFVESLEAQLRKPPLAFHASILDDEVGGHATAPVELERAKAGPAFAGMAIYFSALV